LYLGLKELYKTDDAESLYLTFSYEKNYYGLRITKELIPDGDNIFVTNENKKDYINALCQEIMVN